MMQSSKKWFEAIKEKDMEGYMIKDKLLEKSKEVFVMAIEIYNKPTIKYRVEGFSFFYL